MTPQPIYQILHDYPNKWVDVSEFEFKHTKDTGDNKRIVFKSPPLPQTVNEALENAAISFEQQISWSDDADEKQEELNEFLQVAANQIRAKIS